MEAMEFLASPESDPEQTSPVFETVRVETEALPPLVELGRKLLVRAQEGDTEAVRDLMKQGAPFTTDWLGTSPIHWACQLNHQETVELLLKAGISRDARNKVDRTPLHVTAQEGHIEVLKLLLAHGVDVDAKDMLKMTPLHWAAEYGHEECVRLLLEHGADPSAVNKFDKTPDQIAFDNNRLDITHIVQEYAENPLRHVRRKQAKEKQKLAAAAHKAVLELDRCKTPVKTIDKTTKSPGELREVRIVKLPKRKPQTKLVCESSLQPAVANQTIKTEPPFIDGNTEKTLAMLEAHGITMLPADDSTIVASAVQSGQKVVLTEAGKMALNQTEKPLMLKPPSTMGFKGLIKLPDLLKGKKVITIRADQLINMKNERKVIIQTANSLRPTLWSQPKLDVMQANKKVEVVVKKTMVNNKTHLTSSVVHKPIDTQTQDTTTREMERVKKELEEAKKQVVILREQYLKKEKEAQEYKRIVELLRNQ